MWKKIAIGAGALVLVAAGVLFYLWRQATALPDWYAEDDSLGVDESVEGWVVIPEEGEPFAEEIVGPAGALSEAPTVSGKRKKRRHKAKRRELRSFHKKTRFKDPAIQSAAKASRAIYEDGHLEAGVVLDMSKIERDKLDKKGRSFYDKALDTFPALKRKEVYISIDDRPGSADGYLELSDDAKISIGKLQYPLDKAARKLGVSPKKFRKQLNKEMRRLKMRDPDAPPPEDDVDALMESETAI